jgi:hypothetical protein
MTHREDPNTPQPLTSGDEDEDRRWVIRALVVLVFVTGFFVAIGRLDIASNTTGQSNSAPANPGPSAGSTSLPKGPSH